jgi:hypothetical protein
LTLRHRALRALVALHSRGVERGVDIAEATWAALLSDADRALRLATLRAQYRIDHSCPRALLEAAANDPDAEVRVEAQDLLT